MLTDADHVWHAMYFKHPNERARYIKSQIPHADAEHLLRKYNKFPKIYRDDLVEFAVIVNGKVIDTVQKRQEAHDLAQQQEGYVIIADVPKSESRNPQYDRYYQEIIKTPLVRQKEEDQKVPVETEQTPVEKTEQFPTDPIEVETAQTPVEKTEQIPTEPIEVETEQTPVEETEQIPTDPIEVETEQTPVEETEQIPTEPIEVETEQTPVEETEQIPTEPIEVETEEQQTSITEKVQVPVEETEQSSATVVETEQTPVKEKEHTITEPVQVEQVIYN